MAKIRRDQPLEPSILDRLLDDDPSVSRDVATAEHPRWDQPANALRVGTQWSCFLLGGCH